MDAEPRRLPPIGAVAVLGATGHTGRFVVAELARRGVRPIAIGRGPAASTTSAQVEWRQASLDDPGALDRALTGAAAVINCAGPFLDTADAAIGAALRAGIHYLDVTAEQASAQASFDRFDAAARAVGVLVIPAMGFFGGFGDLLVAAAMGEWAEADDIRIRIALDSWHPTLGTRKTGTRNTAPSVVVTGGRVQKLARPDHGEWTFPAPFGRQHITEVPLSETCLIARHVRTRELHTYLNAAALHDIGDPATPPPNPVDATGRSAQRFVMEATVQQGNACRRRAAQGLDIYAFTAPLVCEAVQRILAGGIGPVGAQPPAAVFDADDFLHALGPDTLMLEPVTA